jgi:ribosomal protein S18 acetylase RimI-like enzyme
VASGWEITEGGRDDLPGLEGLWRFLYAHHSEISTAAIPFISADERWPERLREFQRSVDDRAAVLMIAEAQGEAVGFAFSTLRPVDPIFASGPVGELEVLVVAPERRGEGIGEELTRRSLVALRERGATTVKVVVIAGNDDALRLYRRLGIEPALIALLGPLGEAPGE